MINDFLKKYCVLFITLNLKYLKTNAVCVFFTTSKVRIIVEITSKLCIDV